MDYNNTLSADKAKCLGYLSTALSLPPEILRLSGFSDFAFIAFYISGAYHSFLSFVYSVYASAAIYGLNRLINMFWGSFPTNEDCQARGYLRSRSHVCCLKSWCYAPSIVLNRHVFHINSETNQVNNFQRIDSEKINSSPLQLPQEFLLVINVLK